MNKRRPMKMIKTVLLLAYIYNTLVSGNTAMAASVIRQETVSQNGVLVSKPKSSDMRVKEMIFNNNINSVEAYAAWLENNIQYTKDNSYDEWMSPEDLLKVKKGDCEDFTFLTTTVLRVMGYEPKFIAMMRKNAGHAICAFKKDGRYAWFDNGKLKTTDATTLDEFARYMVNNYKYYEVKELNEETSEWTTLVVKS